MHKYLSATALMCLFASAPAFAQSSTATGVGISNSESNSGALAVNRGNGNSSSSLTVVNPADTRSTVNSNSTMSGTTTQNQNLSGTTTSNINQNGTVTSRVISSGEVTNRVVSSGTTTIKSAPSMVAPGLAAAGLETCLGSASGTVSAIGFGIGGGSTFADEGCQARLDSRTLYAYGLKAAAVARLCQRPDIWRAMPDMCAQYWPSGTPYPAGIVIAAPVGRANVVMSTGGEAIRVVDGRDGVEKDCLNYSHTKQKCYQWAGEKPRAQIRIAAVTPTKVITPAKSKAEKPKAEKPKEDTAEKKSGPAWGQNAKEASKPPAVIVP